MNKLEPRASELLNDIYTSAMMIIDRLKDETLESFASDANILLQDAIAYRFSIIGEASSVLLKKYPDFCGQHPEIPLQQARRMRNVLVHDYGRILWPLVWKTVQDELPQLLASIVPYVNADVELEEDDSNSPSS